MPRKSRSDRFYFHFFFLLLFCWFFPWLFLPTLLRFFPFSSSFSFLFSLLCGHSGLLSPKKTKIKWKNSIFVSETNATPITLGIIESQTNNQTNANCSGSGSAHIQCKILQQQWHRNGFVLLLWCLFLGRLTRHTYILIKHLKIRYECYGYWLTPGQR